MRFLSIEPLIGPVGRIDLRDIPKGQEARRRERGIPTYPSPHELRMPESAGRTSATQTSPARLRSLPRGCYVVAKRSAQSRPIFYNLLILLVGAQGLEPLTR